MSETRKYTENNRQRWDELVDFHVVSAFYDVAGFKAGRRGLSRIERAEVGDVAGKRLLHLLCHFGMDTLSWARLGAEVTGVDISDKAIGQARALAADCNLAARFVRCEVFDSPGQIDQTFDIVFMSWGAICWISDFPALARMAAAPGSVVPMGPWSRSDRHLPSRRRAADRIPARARPDRRAGLARSDCP